MYVLLALRPPKVVLEVILIKSCSASLTFRFVEPRTPPPRTDFFTIQLGFVTQAV